MIRKWVQNIVATINKVTRLTNWAFLIYEAIVIGFSFARSIYWWMVLYGLVMYIILLFIVYRIHRKDD